MWRLDRLSISESVLVAPLPLQNRSSITDLLASVTPDEIYYLAGPSSVAASFLDPAGSVEKIYQPVVDFLEVLRTNHSDIKFFNAASTDCFGNQADTSLMEQSQQRPVSPYGIAKSAAFWAAKNYREAFGVQAASGILTNHESPLRDPGFFSRRVITGLRKVSQGLQRTITLGNLNGGRDWLWAGDAVEAIHLIGSATIRDDYLVGSGRTSTLRNFVATACDALGLDIDEVVEYDAGLARPLDVESVALDPTKISSALGWKATLDFEQIIDRLLGENLD